MYENKIRAVFLAARVSGTIRERAGFNVTLVKYAPVDIARARARVLHCMQIQFRF